MKLAEALVIRADIQKRIQQLKVAIKENVKVQEGDSPDENPNALLVEASQLIQENHRLMTDIQLTNTLVKFIDGRTMIVALAEREQLLDQYNLINNTIEASKNERERYSLSEIKWVKVIDVAP